MEGHNFIFDTHNNIVYSHKHTLNVSLDPWFNKKISKYYVLEVEFWMPDTVMKFLKNTNIEDYFTKRWISGFYLVDLDKLAKEGKI